MVAPANAGPTPPTARDAAPRDAGPGRFSDRMVGAQRVSSLGVLRRDAEITDAQLYEALLKLAVPTGHPVVHAARSVGAGPTERYKLIGGVSRRRSLRFD